MSVAIPLLLIARELRLSASDGPRLGRVDTIALALLCCAGTALAIWVDT